MRETDIAIIGGGLAGSTAAAMLGRAGIKTTLIDPHDVYPADFRCEKLDVSQVAALKKTGLAAPIMAAGTIDRRIWVVRGGRVVDKKPREQVNILYDTMVNTMRGEVPASAETIIGKVNAVTASDDRQTLTLSTGDTVSARLMVFATGLNIGLRHTLGVSREVISAEHSISIGFDLAPAHAERFAFEALTYFSDRAEDRMAYLTLFPIGDTMRANLFVYRTMEDPWLIGFRKAPEESLATLMPHLYKVIGDFRVTSFVKIRPVDLTVTSGHLQAGFVLVGDAFSTSCPAAGTGSNKVFTDVGRLCGTYIPRWLASPGMGKDKIAAFYEDAEKLATDKFSHDKAFALKALSTGQGPLWDARRYGRFVGHLAIGKLRRLRGEPAAPTQLPPASPPRVGEGTALGRS